jgi:hypothetical protein
VSVPFDVIHGVDFSGAKLAGRTSWVARLEPEAVGEVGANGYALAGLFRLEALCGTAERAAALAHLVGMIRDSRRALWALDFPFGFPVEVMGRGAWSRQFTFLRGWAEDGYGAGLECLRRAEALGGPKHIRRLTDIETKAPFDPYHYRIIYQTFHGMRDVLGPLRRDRRTAILPFQYRRLRAARRVVVEACPASTLKLLGLPHQNYKQPEGGRLSAKRRGVRAALLRAVGRLVRLTAAQERTMRRDPGGDALDAVIAAIGAARSWRLSDHRLIARHPRYTREGRLYV